MKHIASEAPENKLEELLRNKTTLGAILSMALPTVASQLIAVIYNYADTIYVGHLNQPEQVAAITLALPLTLVATAIGNLFGIGGGSMLSRALGQHDETTARKCSAFSIYAATILSSILCMAAASGGDSFIHFLGAKEDTLHFAKDYLFWCFFMGGVPAVLSMVLAHLARAEGFARQAGRGLIFGGVLNIILDPLLIFDFGFGMGVAGAALATMLSNVASMLYFIIFFFLQRKHTRTSFQPVDAIPPKRISSEVISVGFPSALLYILSATSNVVLNGLISKHGSHVVAAVGIAKKIDLLPANISLGITTGALPLMAFTYAAGQKRKLEDILCTTLKFSTAILLLLVVFMEIFARELSQVFINDPMTVNYTTGFIRIVCLSMPLFGIITTVNTFYQAVNNPKTAFALSIIRKGPLDIPLMIFFEATFAITKILWVQPLMDFITVLITLAVICRFFRMLHKSTIDSL